MQFSVANRRERKRNRLKNYDYSQDGFYFVTICTKDRKEFFGKIKDNKMMLNKYGMVVENRWLWLEKRYNYVHLDEFIVMPNHLLGILIIGNNHRDRSRPVPTIRSISTTINRIKSLSELIGAFKTTSSKMIHQDKLKCFFWQRSFYDYIIRNEKSLYSIREYIYNNPLQWAMDRNNPTTASCSLPLMELSNNF